MIRFISMLKLYPDNYITVIIMLSTLFAMLKKGRSLAAKVHCCLVVARIFGYSRPQGNNLIQLENLISLARFTSSLAPRCLLD